MANISLSTYAFQNVDGKKVLEYSATTFTVNVIVEGYKEPYTVGCTVEDNDSPIRVLNTTKEYDDGVDYAVWEIALGSEGNNTSMAYEGSLLFFYSENGGELKEETIDYYIRYQGEPFIIASNTTDFTYDADGNNTNSIKRTYVSIRYRYMNSVNTPFTSGWITLGTPTTDSATTDGSIIFKYPISVTPTTEDRKGTMTFSATGTDGKVYSKTLYAQQTVSEPSEPEDAPDLPTGGDEETYAPIWQDIFYPFAFDTSYSIYEEVSRYINQHIGTIKEEVLIYSGKVYVPPTTNSVKVMINKVCQNYFADSYMPEDGYVGQSHNFRKFILRDEYGKLLHTYYFVNDWSYEPLELGLKTNPIIPVIVDGQKLFFSAFADSNQVGYKWGMKYYDGTEEYYNTEYVKNDLYTVFVLKTRGECISQFYFGDRSYDMIPKCKAQYVLYYTNPKGGWDWFPIVGRVTKKDSVTRYTISKNYDNNTREFGKYSYLNEISTKYSLSTGFLTEKQSDRMWELLESNCVYLHNLVDDKVMPVVITDTEVEHKKKERKRKMISYNINVECSQTRERI